jgi:hypothetical protein
MADVVVPGRVPTIANVIALCALPEVQNYIANRTGLYNELANAGLLGEKLKQDQFGNLLKGNTLVVVPAAVAPAPSQTQAA